VTKTNFFPKTTDIKTAYADSLFNRYPQRAPQIQYIHFGARVITGYLLESSLLVRDHQTL
jgi:hypothetical protein